MIFGVAFCHNLSIARETYIKKERERDRESEPGRTIKAEIEKLVRGIQRQGERKRERHMKR